MAQLYAAPSPTNARRLAAKKPRSWASVATSRPNGRLDSRLATHVRTTRVGDHRSAGRDAGVGSPVSPGGAEVSADSTSPAVFFIWATSRRTRRGQRNEAGGSGHGSVANVGPLKVARQATLSSLFWASWTPRPEFAARVRIRPPSTSTTTAAGTTGVRAGRRRWRCSSARRSRSAISS